MPRWLLAGLLAVWAGSAQPAAAQRRPEPSDLAQQARLLYNQGEYDAAIEAAVLAGAQPAGADAAAVVLGRARIERYRLTGDPGDLTAARDALRAVKAGALSPRDRLELAVGLAEVLYLEDAFGPAAQMFEALLERADDLGPTARDRVLDWWATAMDRYAQQRGPAERAALYRLVLERVREEAARDPGSPAAAYWLAAAARGTGDLETAWNAALAAWVRAPLAGTRAAALRADVDRLVVQALIPERARQGTSFRDAEQSIAALISEWEGLKRRWGEDGGR